MSPALARTATVARPFELPAWIAVCPGATLADMLEESFAQGLLDREWADYVVAFIGDREVPREEWATLAPAIGEIVAFRTRPAEWSTIAAIAWQVVQNIAIAFAVNAVVSAFSSTNEAPAFGQIYNIDSSRNEFAAGRPWPVILGTMRQFPPHAALPYTRADGEKVFLYLLLALGPGKHVIDEDSLKVGDTPFSEFPGIEWGAKLSPSDPWPELFPRAAVEDAGSGLIQGADGWVNITTTSDKATKIEVELALVEGLGFFDKDGDFNYQHVDYKLRYREHGTSTWLKWDDGTASDDGTTYNVNRRTTKPFRLTHTRDVPEGRYDVGVLRVPFDVGDANRRRDKVHWTRLRSFSDERPVTDENLNVLAVKIEAGDRLNNTVDQINGVFSRVAATWDDEEEEFGAEAATSNPAELVHWIATGPGVVRPRSDQEIDVPAFGAWAERCTAMGWTCDIEIRSGMALDQLMALVARCGRALLGERAGKLTPILDDEQPVQTQLFTARNSWGFRAQRRFPSEAHAFRIAFNNAEKNYVPDEMLLPFPGYTEETAELIEDQAVPGKVWPLDVAREGYRAIAERIERGEDYLFMADIENLNTARGRRIAVAHYVVAVGRKDARVAGLVLNEAETHVVGLVLDEDVTQTFGDVYGLAWRRVEGDAISVEHLGLANLAEGLLPPALTSFSDGSAYSDGSQHAQPGYDLTGRELELIADGGVPIASAPKLGDLVTFGDLDIETLDLTVVNIAPASDFEAEISAVAYSDALFAGDDAEEPEWESNVSGDAFPLPPQPIIVGVSATPSGIFVDFDFPLAEAYRVEGIELWWLAAEDDSARFEPVSAPLPGAARLGAFPAGQAGKDYVLRVVAVGANGRKTPSADTVVTSGAFASASFSGRLTNAAAVVVTNPDGTGGDYSTAGGVFQVYVGDVGLNGDESVVFAVVSASAGLAIEIDEDGNYSVLSLADDYGQARLRATKKGLDVEVVYSVAKSKTGGSGAPGDPPAGFTATITIPPSSTGVNLRALANTAGYTGHSDATITFVLEAGDTVTGAPGNPNGATAIDTGEWPHTEYEIDLTLEIEATAIGEGGGGKAGAGGQDGQGQPGGFGGAAVNCRAPIAIANEGTLRGGGGGGAGGGSARKNQGVNPSVPFRAGGGGGGGGKPNGSAGAGGNPPGDEASPGAAGEAGSGTRAGGDGGVTDYATGGDGGDGGDYGAAGGDGETGAADDGGIAFAAGTGGAAGAAIRKNGHTCPVTGSGTIVGDVVA